MLPRPPPGEALELEMLIAALRAVVSFSVSAPSVNHDGCGQSKDDFWMLPGGSANMMLKRALLQFFCPLLARRFLYLIQVPVYFCFPRILMFSFYFFFSPIIKSADSILFPLKILHFAKACTAPLQDGLRRCSVCGAAFATPFGAFTCLLK